VGGGDRTESVFGTCGETGRVTKGGPPLEVCLPLIPSASPLCPSHPSAPLTCLMTTFTASNSTQCSALLRFTDLVTSVLFMMCRSTCRQAGRQGKGQVGEGQGGERVGAGAGAGAGAGGAEPWCWDSSNERTVAVGAKAAKVVRPDEACASPIPHSTGIAQASHNRHRTSIAEQASRRHSSGQRHAPRSAECAWPRWRARGTAAAGAGCAPARGRGRGGGRQGRGEPEPGRGKERVGHGRDIGEAAGWPRNKRDAWGQGA